MIHSSFLSVSFCNKPGRNYLSPLFFWIIPVENVLRLFAESLSSEVLSLSTSLSPSLGMFFLGLHHSNAISQKKSIFLNPNFRRLQTVLFLSAIYVFRTVQILGPSLVYLSITLSLTTPKLQPGVSFYSSSPSRAPPSQSPPHQLCS